MTDTNTFLLFIMALDELAQQPDGPAIMFVLKRFEELFGAELLHHAVHVCTVAHKPQSDDVLQLLAAVLRSHESKAAEHLGGVLNAWRGDLVTRWDRLEALCPAE